MVPTVIPDKLVRTLFGQRALGRTPESNNGVPPENPEALGHYVVRRSADLLDMPQPLTNRWTY